MCVSLSNKTHCSPTLFSCCSTVPFLSGSLRLLGILQFPGAHLWGQDCAIALQNSAALCHAISVQVVLQRLSSCRVPLTRVHMPRPCSASTCQGRAGDAAKLADATGLKHLALIQKHDRED